MSSAARRAILVAVIVVLAAAGAACTPATGLRSTPPAPAATPEPAATDACDFTNLPNWPKPGHVSTTGIVPVIASSERVVGPSRMVWTLVNDQNQPIAAPDMTMQVGFFDLCANASQPAQVVNAEFAWGITNVRGFYITSPTFTHPGTWGAAVVITDAAGKQTGARIMFDVLDRGTTPAIGDLAPSVKTPTLADVGGDVKRIASDPNPNPDFYRVSVDQALASKTPFVLVMATPAFCTSAECGPTLDHVKQVVAAHPITAINVEPYELEYTNGRLQPVLQNGNFVPVEATTLYGVPTEPWIFVIDRSGRVVGSFEAVVADDELTSAIAKALGGS